MLHKIFGGLRATAIPMLAVLAALAAVNPASAIHPRGTRSHVRPTVKIRPNIQWRWLQYIGVEAMTGDNGAVFLSVDAGGLADQAGLDSGDSIQSVDGNTVSTPQQLNDAIGASYSSGQGSAALMVFDVHDPGQPAVPLTLSFPAASGVAPQRAHR